MKVALSHPLPIIIGDMNKSVQVLTFILEVSTTWSTTKYYKYYSWSLFWLLVITEGATSRLRRNSSVAFSNHLFGSPNIFEMNFSCLNLANKISGVKNVLNIVVPKYVTSSLPRPELCLSSKSMYLFTLPIGCLNFLGRLYAISIPGVKTKVVQGP